MCCEAQRTNKDYIWKTVITTRSKNALTSDMGAWEKTLEWVHGLRLAWPDDMGLTDNATLPSVGLFPVLPPGDI